ncbi:MAG: zf-HC2 domain-containing protein [Planctomycetota bacterium]
MKTNTVISCAEAVSSMRGYVEGELSNDLKAVLLEHVNGCVSCRSNLAARQQVISALGNAYGQIQISNNFDKTANSCLNQLRSNPQAVNSLPTEDALLTAAVQSSGSNFMFSATPWWGVSVALHVLVILLAGLISMSLALPPSEDAIVVITELQPPALIRPVELEKPKNDNRAVLESKHDTPPTDPMSSDPSDIVVPPEVLALAELGDHWETINLDRPDTHSAFGNPDSHFFYSIKGNDEPEGGGGSGGCSLDNLIGVGGAASPGSGGGWGGGHGTGIGVGTGSGKGSFGSRTGGGRRLMVKRHGGSKATEAGVDRGLEWLARNQEADGHWNNGKHGGRHANMDGDAAMTGFALLAFLGAGHTEKVGKYKENVQKGVKWLIDNQKDGRWAPLNYTQGIATMALGEAAAMARVPETKKAAQAAINAVDKAQNQTGPSDREAWDYYPNGGINDSSVMVWNILALKSCKVGGLSVNPSAFEGCLNWLNAGQLLDNHKPTDIDPYFEGGSMAYRGTCANPKSQWYPAALTAAAGLCRMMIGSASGDTVGVAGPCNYILKNCMPKQYPFDLYFGYYATLLMFQKGGDHWKVWNEAMKKLLIEAQCKGGQNDGSWNPLCSQSIDDSRVMSTALAILCLEVYYRYAKLAPGAVVK